MLEQGKLKFGTNLTNFCEILDLYTFNFCELERKFVNQKKNHFCDVSAPDIR